MGGRGLGDRPPPLLKNRFCHPSRNNIGAKIPRSPPEFRTICHVFYTPCQSKTYQTQRLRRCVHYGRRVMYPTDKVGRSKSAGGSHRTRCRIDRFWTWTVGRVFFPVAMRQFRPKNREKAPEFLLQRYLSFQPSPKKSQKNFKWGAAAGERAKG